MDLNSGDSVQQRRYVNLIDFDEDGHGEIVGRVDLIVLKECPSCYLMFKGSDYTYFYRCTLLQIPSESISGGYYKQYVMCSFLRIK